MPDSKKDPLLPPNDAPVEQEEAPASSARPGHHVVEARAANDDSSDSFFAAPSSTSDASSRDSTPGDDATPRVSREVLRAFLNSKATQRRIRQVVRANVPPKTPKYVVDEVVSRVNLKAWTTKSPARSEDRLLPWISMVAHNETNEYFRGEQVHVKWLNRDVEVEELPPEPTDDDAPAGNPPPPSDMAPANDGALPEWLIGPWLEERVAHHARDRETLDILREKAQTGKSHEQLAAERRMTVPALNNRIHKFKKKYAPLRDRYLKRQRERRNALLLLLLFATVVAVLAWAIRSLRPDADRVLPDPSLASASARPTPSASTSASAAPAPLPLPLPAPSSSFYQARPPPRPTPPRDAPLK